MEFSDKITAKIGPAALPIDPLPLPQLLSTAAITLSPASQQFTTTSTPEPLTVHRRVFQSHISCQCFCCRVEGPAPR